MVTGNIIRSVRMARGTEKSQRIIDLPRQSVNIQTDNEKVLVLAIPLLRPGGEGYGG